MIKPIEPVITSHMFAPLSQELILLLKSLNREEWEYAVPGSKWNVRQVACHLLDGSLRKLSFHREGHPLPQPETPINKPEDLLTFLNRLNTTWVQSAERLSPEVIISQMTAADHELSAFFNSLNPKDTAFFPVAWAGETESENWFDIAREFTEKWYHQQQIREAVKKPFLTESTWLTPVIDTFIRGLPHTFNISETRNINTVSIHIHSGVDLYYTLTHVSERWALHSGYAGPPDSSLKLSADTAWRMFTGNISALEALIRIDIEGNPLSAEIMTRLISLMK